MSDNDELEQLRAELNELKTQLAHDNQSREQLLQACGKIVPSLDHAVAAWQQRVTGVLEAARRAPELEKQREQALLPRFALLATRQRAVEEQFEHTCALVIEMHSFLKLILAIQRGEEI